MSCVQNGERRFLLLPRLLQSGTAIALAFLHLAQDVRPLRHRVHLLFGARDCREELVFGLTDSCTLKVGLVISHKCYRS
jgi:hypothetical protein